MKAAKKLSRLENETKLQRVVRFWLNNEGRNYDNGWQGAYADLMHGGCASGMVSHLCYYTDTVRFYRRHKAEIDALLAESLDSIGVSGPGELFGEKWMSDDPLANEHYNQNLLAWFGFEETARNIASLSGVEL